MWERVKPRLEQLSARWEPRTTGKQGLTAKCPYRQLTKFHFRGRVAATRASAPIVQNKVDLQFYVRTRISKPPIYMLQLGALTRSSPTVSMKGNLPAFNASAWPGRRPNENLA